MKRLVRFRVAAVLAFVLAGAVSAAAQAEGPGEMRLKLITIMDPTGFEKPMPAARSILPADWTTTGGAAALNAEVTRQSLMIAYLNDFRLMMYLTLFAVPLLLLLRAPARHRA